MEDEPETGPGKEAQVRFEARRVFRDWLERDRAKNLKRPKSG